MKIDNKYILKEEILDIIRDYSVYIDENTREMRPKDIRRCIKAIINRLEN